MARPRLRRWRRCRRRRRHPHDDLLGGAEVERLIAQLHGQDGVAWWERGGADNRIAELHDRSGRDDLGVARLVYQRTGRTRADIRIEAAGEVGQRTRNRPGSGSGCGLGRKVGRGDPWNAATAHRHRPGVTDCRAAVPQIARALDLQIGTLIRTSGLQGRAWCGLAGCRAALDHNQEPRSAPCLKNLASLSVEERRRRRRRNAATVAAKHAAVAVEDQSEELHGRSGIRRARRRCLRWRPR